MQKFTRILLTVLEYIFFIGVPIGLFIWKCTTIGAEKSGTKFIVGAFSYIILFFVVIIIKKTVFKNFIADMKIKIANFQTELAIETDPEKAKHIEKGLHKYTIIRDLLDVLPFIIIIAFITWVVAALENDIITLKNVLALMILSVVIGYVCRIIKHATEKSKIIK